MIPTEMAMKVLGNGLVKNVPSNIYTVPIGCISIVREVLFCNVTNQTVTINMYYVPSGETEKDEHKIFHDFKIDAGETFTTDFKTILEEAESIYISSSVDNAIAFRISGLETN